MWYFLNAMISLNPHHRYRLRRENQVTQIYAHYSRRFHQQLGEHPSTMKSPLSLCLFPNSLCILTVLGIQPPWHRLLSSFYSRGDKNNLLSFRIMKWPLALCFGRLHFHCFRGILVNMAVVTTAIKKIRFLVQMW